MSQLNITNHSKSNHSSTYSTVYYTSNKDKKKQSKIRNEQWRRLRDSVVLQRGTEAAMGQMGVGNPRAGNQNQGLVGKLRHAGDGGGGVRRGGAVLQGTGGPAELP
ncbi:hypothetical protein LINGRAHAP2_LOCUS15735 [Linum grandiflorum]